MDARNFFTEKEVRENDHKYHLKPGEKSRIDCRRVRDSGEEEKWPEDPGQEPNRQHRQSFGAVQIPQFVDSWEKAEGKSDEEGCQ